MYFQDPSIRIFREKNLEKISLNGIAKFLRVYSYLLVCCKFIALSVWNFLTIIVLGFRFYVDTIRWTD